MSSTVRFKVFNSALVSWEEAGEIAAKIYVYKFLDNFINMPHVPHVLTRPLGRGLAICFALVPILSGCKTVLCDVMPL